MPRPADPSGCCTTASRRSPRASCMPARTAVERSAGGRRLRDRCPNRRRSGWSRLAQQVGDLERWESFGQQQAREQLCERAEALARGALDPAQVAREVKKLRDEWKTLDQAARRRAQALWERFDGACETCVRAGGPALRRARGAAQGGPRAARRVHRDGGRGTCRRCSPNRANWRAIERWLRDTDRAGAKASSAAWIRVPGRSSTRSFQVALAPAARRAVRRAGRGQGAAPRADRGGGRRWGPRRWNAMAPSQVKASRRGGRNRRRRCALRSATSGHCGNSSAPPATRCSRRASAPQGRGRASRHTAAARWRTTSARSLERSRNRARRTRRKGAAPCAKPGGMEGGLARLRPGCRVRWRGVHRSAVTRSRPRCRGATVPARAAVWQTLAAKNAVCEDSSAARRRPRRPPNAGPRCRRCRTPGRNGCRRAATPR